MRTRNAGARAERGGLTVGRGCDGHTKDQVGAMDSTGTRTTARIKIRTVTRARGKDPNEDQGQDRTRARDLRHKAHHQ